MERQVPRGLCRVACQLLMTGTTNVVALRPW